MNFKYGDTEIIPEERFGHHKHSNTSELQTYIGSNKTSRSFNVNMLGILLVKDIKNFSMAFYVCAREYEHLTKRKRYY